jgi:hypothetical protein
MFKLAESRGSSRSLYCGAEGLYLGPSPLIELHDGIYRVRSQEEIATLTAAMTRLPMRRSFSPGCTPSPPICSTAISAGR